MSNSLISPTHKKVQKEAELSWEFSDKKVTAWGGLRWMKELWTKMNFRNVLEESGLPNPQSNRGYKAAVMIESFMVCVWAGGVRFSHTALVRFDDVLKEIFGWKKVASVSTFTRFFKRFKREEVDVVFGRLGKWFWEKLPGQTMTLDLDSSVMTRYGEQEGAKKGYNPRKRGRASHHPLFAFVSDIRMVLHAWLCPGNTSDSNGIILFLQEALSFLGDSHRVGLIRADSGFFGGAFIDFLEKSRISYIIATRLNKRIKSQISGLSKWTQVDAGLGVTEMYYQAHLWTAARRIIVVRQEEKRRSKAMGKLLIDCPGYRYQAYVTDSDLPPVEIWRLYRGRADSETRINELKYDFGLSGFCMDSFYGTEAAFRSVLLAYNLMSLFRQAVLQSSQAIRLSTMRFQCFALGAWIGRQQRKRTLRISVSPKRRPWFEGLWARLQLFQAPWPIPS